MTQAVACLISESELACFLMWTLVTQTVSYLVSAGELAGFSICTLWVTQTVAFFA